jgi:undecaprenyl-diphosphatase
LNGLGSETFDGLWLFITKQSNWIPLFYSLYVIYTKLGVKQTLYLLLFIAVLVTITDQTTNLFKNGFQRLRPCNNLEILPLSALLKLATLIQFFSGHAANSMAVATFVYFNFKDKIKFFDFCSFGRSSLRTAGSWIALSSRHTYIFIWIYLGFLMFKATK